MLVVEIVAVIAAITAVMLWWLGFVSEVPTHDESKRYQELRKRPDDPEFAVVRSFRHRRNAMRWIRERKPFRGTLRLYDSRNKKTLYNREVH